MPRVLRILVVSDDAQVGRWLQHRIGALRDDCALTLESYEAFERRLATTGTDEIDALFAVLGFEPDETAASFAWLDRIKGVPGSPELVVVAEDGDELSAVQSMRRGAVDYLPRKLISTELLDAAIALCVTSRRRPAPAASRPATASRQRGDAAMHSMLKVARDLIPRYMLLDTLGESARASVYLAHSAALNRHVALKVSCVAESDEPQFAREYETVGAIRHESVVDIYDYGMHEGREFIAMEYFPCGDLKARLQNPLSEFEALDYLQRIAAALAVVHQQGVLHRDLKPPNIMLREEGQVVLIDFGLAKAITDATRSTAAGVLRGSPYYMSPEQAQGQELDGRSDLYSLGVIFHEMLTGNKPYLGATAVEVLQQHVSAPMPELPPALRQYQALLEGMMAKTRDDRFATADELLTHLLQLAAWNAPHDPVDLLLLQGEVAGLQLDALGAIAAIHNAPLLATWMAGDTTPDTLPARRDALLEELFGPRNVRAVLQGLEELAEQPGARLQLGTLPARQARAGSPVRHYAVTVHRTDNGRLLLLQDCSQRLALLQELQEARAGHETALAVLRAPPDGLRLFLGSAMASVSAIRATLRMPARTREAVREKLGRLKAEAASLAAEAGTIGLSPVVSTCEALADAAAALQAREDVSGDELLPLAPRVDAIASSIGNSSRIEEQRYEPPPATAEPTRRARRNAAWHDVSERRWSEFLRRRGEEIGTLARLSMTGAHQVPAFHRRHVDEILQHLLKNALDHGIETPEERLAQGKSAAGRISIGFAPGDQGGVKMTVHDDGRGFDLARIGRAAVQSGLLSEESLSRREAGDLVGLIFKPSFTTEGLHEGDGQGRGMSYLRRKVTRLGGQISVATKAGRYTLFTIELPESEVSDEPAGVSQAMP